MKNFLHLFLLSILCGCTTVSQIDKNYRTVYTNDGINEKEAVFIAQKQCLKEPACSGNVRISTPEIHNDAGEWYVLFWSKELDDLNHAFSVTVDEKTGQVKKTETVK